MTHVVETKRHVNKPTQTYSCAVCKQGDGWVVLTYVSDRDWRFGDVLLPARTRTLALYETDAPCVVWRMIGPDNQLKGHLFHICCDLQVLSDGVDYLDLLLDIWVDAEGHVILLDEDELNDCVIRKLLSVLQARKIKATARDAMENWRIWVAKLDARLA